MTIDRVETLEKKVAELERARKRERIAGVALLALIVAVACKPSTLQTTPGAIPSPAAPSVVRAASADGQREAVLSPDGLTISVGGKERAKLFVTADASHVGLLLRDSRGQGRAALQATDGPVGLSLTDRNAKDVVIVAADETDAAARVELMGPQHFLAAVADSRASLALSSADGKAFWHAP